MTRSAGTDAYSIGSTFMERRKGEREEEYIDKARKFHEAYERLAPQFGYETRPDTKEFDPESANGRLMVAVMKELNER